MARRDGAAFGVANMCESDRRTLGLRLADGFWRKCRPLVSGALLPLAAWLVGMALFTVVSVECMFADDHPVFLVGRVTAYVTALVFSTLIAGVAALFGLCCGAMLRWLGEQATARQIAKAVCKGFWVFGAFVWLGVALLAVAPPEAITPAQLLGPTSVLEEALAGALAFRWMSGLRYVFTGAFLLLVAWLLARHGKPLNAALAVAFGAGAVAVLMGGLTLLGGGSDAHW